MLAPTETLSRQLREARERALMSQVEAARWIGCSTRTYQAWELGEAFPQPRHRRGAYAFINRFSEVSL